jgi:autotransporter-associated beta strand protein
VSNSITLTENSVIDTVGNTIILNGNISGNEFGLTFIGGGSVQFTGTNNTYTGHTLINVGTDLIGNIPLSSRSYPSIIVDAGQTYVEEAELAGPGALVKDGPGELELANAAPNTYEGGTVIKNGILTADNDSQIPEGSIIFNATNGNPVLKAGNSLSTVANDIIFTSHGTVNSNGHDVSFTGHLTGDHDFYKIGDGEVTITNTGNGQTGTTNVLGGSLAVSDIHNLGNTSEVKLVSGGLHITKTMTSGTPVRLGGQ